MPEEAGSHELQETVQDPDAPITTYRLELRLPAQKLSQVDRTWPTFMESSYKA